MLSDSLGDRDSGHTQACIADQQGLSDKPSPSAVLPSAIAPWACSTARDYAHQAGSASRSWYLRDAVAVHCRPQRNPTELWRSQITLEGFKSYKEQTVTEPFSNRINVVGMASAHLVYIPYQQGQTPDSCFVLAVGANGSGKSNFFQGEP